MGFLYAYEPECPLFCLRKLFGSVNWELFIKKLFAECHGSAHKLRVYLFTDDDKATQTLKYMLVLVNQLCIQSI